jgi:hypothetical protein
VLGCAVPAGSGITATIVPSGNNVAIPCDTSIGSNYVYSCNSSGELNVITACPALSDCTGGNNVVEAAIDGVNYKVHIFNSTGNLSCQPSRYVDVLVVGAGGNGGGGGGSGGGGGGGGAGGVVFKTRHQLTVESYLVTVGSPSPQGITTGGDSTFDTITAYGGGAGGNYGTNGTNGGSGGGAGRDFGGSRTTATKGTGGGTLYGNSGGIRTAGITAWSGGGGGGGAGGVGSDGLGGSQSIEKGGSGGAGIANPIYSTPAFIAGGGGGGNQGSTKIASLGGSGVGGNGGTFAPYLETYTKPNSGAVNTCSGCGGGGGRYDMGYGSSGIVIIRYVK